MKARLELKLTRQLHNGALSLREIKFFADCGSKARGHFGDKRAQNKADYRFDWKVQTAMRATTVLLLRHFAPGGKGARWEGGSGSLAASLHEVITQAEESFWFKRLWIEDTKSKLALPKCFFDGTGNTHVADYVVFLGEIL